MDSEIEENQSKEIITFKSLVNNILFKFKIFQLKYFLGSK
jgi:hypothetical protein